MISSVPSASILHQILKRLESKKMGKIVASGGISFNDEEGLKVFEKIVELCHAKEPKVLYVPTAGHDNYDDFDDLKKQFSDLGCKEYDLLILTDESLTYEEIENKIFSHFEINFLNECLTNDEIIVSLAKSDESEYVIGKVKEKTGRSPK